MTNLRSVAFIGNSLPRQCGIATFSTDLHQAVSSARSQLESCIVAMNDRDDAYSYPPYVGAQIRDNKVEDYVKAAAFLNAGKFDVVCLQHEFGIFGGEAGSHILALLSRLKMPIVTTLHTVLAKPSVAQRAVMERLIELSASLVVMAEKGRQILLTHYDVPADKIEVIAHGIPDFAFVEPDDAKMELGFSDRAVILTFGLLSHNKGIEVVIDAMPEILKSSPDAVYVVLGATHPHLVRDQGEAYREALIERANRLGVARHVEFIDRFVDLPTLLKYIAMCDVYVTPYLDEAQMTSGTLAYSFGLGKAVVSTPYWHAQELLADGKGILVPFGDSPAVGREVSALLADDQLRFALRARAYSISRSMTWANVSERYLTLFEMARRGSLVRLAGQGGRASVFRESRALPALRSEYLRSMCDDTGLFQHAVHCVPDRSHGYCIDDNARALVLSCALNTSDDRLSELLTSRFAAFVQHAWNPDTGRFRNFMSFDRRWLEDAGSEDSHARTLWSLGECARNDDNPARRAWARCLFATALTAAKDFTSPRAWAFTLLGLDAYCVVAPDDADAARLRRDLAARLMAILSAVATADWYWFEEGLAYDNARLSQALILTGNRLSDPAYVTAGLKSLHWLVERQTSENGFFQPVGTAGFAERRMQPQSFDQQPVEAAATISACLAACRTDGDAAWETAASAAFAWFLGSNDLLTSLVDRETGSCRDGLHPDRANENRGGESVVSYLLALSDMRQFRNVNNNVQSNVGLVPALAVGV